MPLSLTSSAFEQGGAIPRRYTCDGQDISPPLEWSGAPAATRSFALIVDDPDAPDPKAPERTFVHWVLYNLPPSSQRMSEGVKPDELPAGARQGLNDWNRIGYGGPCPPIGRHRYFHKLYALDAVLADTGNMTKADLEKAMAGHMLERTELIGTFERED